MTLTEIIAREDRRLEAEPALRIARKIAPGYHIFARYSSRRETREAPSLPMIHLGGSPVRI